MIRRFPAFFLAMVLVAATTPWNGIRAQTTDPQEFIRNLADEAVAALTEDVSREKRVERFRELLHEHFAVQNIGVWVLGRYWRIATPEERREYLQLFERLIVTTYVERFSEYSGETLEVTGATPKGEADIIVSSNLLRPTGGAPVPVSWRLHPRDDSYRIVDVIVEGISMGQTQRSEFGSVIRKNGGKVEGLLAELRKIQTAQ